MARRLKLKTKEDFVRRLSKAPPLDCIEELIWNALDEEATEVDVILNSGPLGKLESVAIVDNGNSLSYEDAPQAFESLGESQKIGRSLTTGVRLHGRLGQGRHKALGLGDSAVWRFAYRKSRRLFQYEVQATAGRDDPFYLTDETPAPKGASRGCVVTVTSCKRNFPELSDERSHHDLTARLAQFLLVHPDRKVSYNGRPIQPRHLVERQKTLRKFKVSHAGDEHDVSITIFHWKPGQQHREAFFCGESGHPLQRLGDTLLMGSDDGTVFIKSTLFDDLHQDNLLQTFETSANDTRKQILQGIRSRVRRYFQGLRQADAENTLDQLREEGSYPYRRSPQSEIETIERRVFDLCTINISRHLPNFHDGMDVPGRTLLLRMVQEALTQNPSSVGKVIREVCRLPQDDARRFADLLDDVPLSKIVDAAHRVAERLEFLKLFKAVVCLDPFERFVKERTELQRLLSPNLWLFGEEYSLGTDDQDIKTILQKHIHILGRDELQPEIDPRELRRVISEYNKPSRKTAVSLERIPDFMIWRQFKERRADEYEFLVIEIKRPGVSIGRKEHDQIEDYALAVTKSPFADQDRTRWVFVIISDTLSPEIETRATQQHLPRFTTLRPDNAQYEIRAFPWSVLIQSAEARHEHLRKWLDHNVSIEEALERSQTVYRDILPAPKEKRSVAHRKPKSK